MKTNDHEVCLLCYPKINNLTYLNWCSLKYPLHDFIQTTPNSIIKAHKDLQRIKALRKDSSSNKVMRGNGEKYDCSFK